MGGGRVHPPHLCPLGGICRGEGGAVPTQLGEGQELDPTEFGFLLGSLGRRRKEDRMAAGLGRDQVTPNRRDPRPVVA
jgi:hypothetical protein